MYFCQIIIQLFLLIINLLILNTMKSRTVIALLAGAAVGAVLGIFLAPDKGEESRKKVKKTAEDCIDKVKGSLSNLKKGKDENVEESEEE